MTHAAHEMKKMGRGSCLAAFRSGLLGRTSTVVLGLMAGLSQINSAHTQAVNLQGGVNNILADGRTRTSIETTGNHTRIHTDTVSQGTGFNSFSDFRQAAGTRVDLFVPDNAGNLVNIVRNGPVVIDGVLNSFKNGEIGGNVFFASSQGFIVGANGTINVGSLTVNTPTHDFIEGVISPDGTVNNAAANQLMGGIIPISPDGVISIAGRINADGGITLQGQRVSIHGGSVQLDDVEINHRTKFQATVNVGGISEGAALVSRGGKIEIIAAQDVRIGGRLDASASGSGKGDRINVSSGRDIHVGEAAQLRSDGAGVSGSAGRIDVIAGATLTVLNGASFSGIGRGHGEGGFLELSGRTAHIGGLSFDLRSEEGRNGTLLIDPYDLYIGGSVPVGTSGDYSLMPSITSNGVDVYLQADNSITIVSGGHIDTMSASGSGDITLEAAIITIADGAWLTAEGVGGGAAGTVTLNARAGDGGLIGAIIGTDAHAAITIADGALIRGGDIFLNAVAHANAGLVLLAGLDASATISIGSATIAASGAFDVHAEASVTADGDGGIALPIGVIAAGSDASISIGGNAVISAASASLTADSAVTVIIETESLVPEDASADGAVAVSVIDSKATVDIGGNASLNITGALELAATNAVISKAIAAPQQAAFGASVGVSVVDVTTRVAIGGAADVTTGSLQMSAATLTAIEVSAKAAAGGAEEPQEDSETANYLDQYGENASTDEGGVSIVGALAISDLTSTTLASLGSSVALKTSGAVSVTTQSTNSATLVADGSAVESDVGVGVAVGINLAHITNDAVVAQQIGATGAGVAGLSVSAGMNGVDAVNAFSTSATSGAGAKNVGIAGSFAVNLIDTQASAVIGSDSLVYLAGNGSVALIADSATEVSGEALPSGDGASGDSVGVGASVAMNIVANRTVAEIGDNAAVTGAGDVSLAAASAHSNSATANAGSAGGISITPALALSLINNTTTAQLGSGPALVASGSVTLLAIQQSTTKTLSSGEAAGGTAAIGAALSLAIIDDIVIATTARNITAGGAVGFSAMGASFSELTAKASATGAAADKGSEDSDEPDVNAQVTAKAGAGTDKQKKAGVGSAKQQDASAAQKNDEAGRSAETSEGGVSVAAAIAINVQGANVTAGVPDGVAITSGGALTITAVGNTDGKLDANGSAVGGEDTEESKVGIGAAVAVNHISALTVARLGAAAHSLGGLTVEALSLDIAAFRDDAFSSESRTDIYEASATSGAGGSTVGVAGSLALNLIDTEKSATVANGASLTFTGVDRSMAITADNRTETTTKALPVGDGATGGKVGVGASVAIAIVANRAVAEIENGVSFATTAGAIELAANGAHTVTTEAESGSAGGISITPVLGLSIISNSTAARIGTGGLLTTGGDITLAAMQTSHVSTSASGKAAGEKAAIGAALALAIVDDEVEVTTRRSLASDGNVSLSASGISSGELIATASASGAAEADDEGNAQDGKTVDDNVTGQMQHGAGRQQSAGVGSDAQKSSTTASANDENGRSAKSEEGKVSVAAAVAVNVTNASVSASVNGVDITAAGSLNLSSEASTSADLSADGSATGAQVGVGVAVAVNALNKINTALLSNGSFSANGVSVTAGQARDGGNSVADIHVVKASSGAGGSKVGIAGALALNLIDAKASASIGSSAIVNAGTGSSTILAEQEIEATAEATPSGDGTSGGKVGIGASVALNLLTATTMAELADGAVFQNGQGLDVSATTGLSSTTKAQAGASGGIAIDAVVALAMLDTTTTARIGTGAGLSMSTGAVTVSATSTGKHEANADGAVKAGSVGVGAAAAVIIGAGDMVGALANTSVTSATLARNVTAGSVEVAAVSTRSYVSEATATAGGGKSDKDDSDKPQAKPATSTDTLAKTENHQKGSGAAEQQSGGNSEGTGKNTNGKKVQVAAAVGVATAQDVVTASILGGLVITAADAVAVTAASTVDMATLGSGQAGSFTAPTGNAQVGVGIGVALGIMTGTTSATIGNGVQITDSGSVDVSATTRENVSADFMDRLTARAIAGASSSKVSVAGALAVGISLTETRAAIGDGVTISSAGAVAVSTDSQSRIGTKAMSASYTSGNVAVGASIATVYSERDQNASIGAGNSITAGSVSVTSISREVNGSFQFDMPTSVNEEGLNGLTSQLTESALLGSSNYYAEAVGASAAPSGAAAIQGSFTVMIFSDQVKATIGESATSSAATTINAAGAVTLSAESAFTARALSGGIAFGNTVGVGVSASVIVSSGVTQALLASGTQVTNSASFEARASASQSYEAYGVSAAGASTAGVAGVATVIVSENRSETVVEAGTDIQSDGDVTVSAANDFDSFALAGGAAAGGTAGIGAAGAVVVVDNITRAALLGGTNASNGVSIDAGGTISIIAAATQSAKTIAAAGGAAGTAGVGAGGAVYVLGTTTEALVGNYARIGQGTRPLALALTATDETDLTTISGAFGGGGTVGVGAAAAVGVVGKTISAAIGQNALVSAGDVALLADNMLTATTLGIGVGVGGKAGVAGAVGVFSITDTTLASIGSSAVVYATNTVAVVALNGTSLDTISGGAGIGGVAGVGASVSVTLIDTMTHATIADEASVTALGLGAARNYRAGYDVDFVAYGGSDQINGPDLSNFEDLERGAGDSDAPLTAADAMAAGFDILSKKRVATPITASANGVIVNAASGTQVRSMAVGGAVGGVAGVSLAADVPIITTNTQARIGNNALINQGSGVASGNQSVMVAAASDLYHFGLAGSAAGGGAAGVGGGAAVSIVDTTTIASIGDGTRTAAAGDIVVSAKAREDFMSTAAAGAVGGYAGVAGGVATIVVDAKTSASIGGTAFAHGNVDVIADDQTRVAMLAGSVGLSGAVGVGASIGVVKLDKKVSAFVADNASVTALGGAARRVYTGDEFSTTRIASGLNVFANTNQSVFTLAVAGGGGLYVGVAGAVTLELFDIATSATIGSNAKINEDNTGAASNQDVVVVARDSTSTLVIDGGVAGGAVGVAGAVDVGVFRNSSTGAIQDGARINAARHVSVAGLSNKATNSTTVSAAGGLVGVAAGISIYSFGDGVSQSGEGSQKITDATENGDSNLGSITGMADDQAHDGKANSLLAESDNAHVRQISQQAQDRRSTLDFTSATSLTVPGGTSATIGSATINAGGTVSVGTIDDLDARFATGAIAGGIVGVGAGIGVITVGTTNTAQIRDAANIAAGGLSLAARTHHSLTGLSIAGTVGYTAAVSADVAILHNTSVTRASLTGSQIVVTGGAVAVNATSTRTLDAKGIAAAVSGGAAVGASIATAKIGGIVETVVDDTIIGSGSARAASVTFEASSTDRASASTIAAAGGLGVAAQGSVALANISTTTKTSVENSLIYASGRIGLASLSRQAAMADAKGIALAGGVAVGASVANATVSAGNRVGVNTSMLDGGSIAIEATLGSVAGRNSAEAFAAGSSGALVGVTATEANATNNATSEALVSDSRLKAAGLVRVAAVNTTAQYAEALGITGGVVAIGSNTSRARSTTVTTAQLVNLQGIEAGSVEIHANGRDDNFADAVAGTGGVVAGTASQATTSSTSTTLAAADTTSAAEKYTIAATHGLVDIKAVHASGFGGNVDSTQASLVGASGARLNHTVDSTVDARLGQYAVVRAADLSIAARNLTRNDSSGWNVNSGSGGLVDAPAGSVNVNILHNTNASIGRNADIHLLAQSLGTSGLVLEAYNDIAAHQHARLDSGGAVAVASAEVIINAVTNAAVAIGDNSDIIVDLGDIAIGAWGQANIEARSVATTSGLAGAPSGKAYALYTGNNTATIGDNVLLEVSRGISPVDGSLPSSGTISIGAGTRPDGQVAVLNFRTTVDLFNNTAIPIDSTPDAKVVATVNSTLLTGQALDPRGIRAAGDIRLSALRGDITASAVGIGKNIYLEALSKTASAISNLFGGGDVTFEVHGGSTKILGAGNARIDGLVLTGLERHKSLTLQYTDENCNIAISACLAPPVDGEIHYTVSEPEAVGTSILERLAELELLLFQYGGDPVAKGAYQSEIRFLQTKLAALGLGSFNSSGVFVPGEYVGPNPTLVQAQIDVEKAQITLLNGSMTSTGTIINDQGVGLSGNLTSAYTNIGTNAGTITSTIDAVLNSATSETPAPSGAAAEVTTRKNTINGLVTTGNGYAVTINDKINANTTLQGQIDSQLATIATQQTALEAALIANDLTAIAAAENAIDTAFGLIDTALSSISANLVVIKNTAANAASNATSLKTAIEGYVSWANTNLAGLPGGGTLAGLSNNVSSLVGNGTETNFGYLPSVGSISSALTTYQTEVQASITALNDTTGGAGTIGGPLSLSQYSAHLADLTGTIAAYTHLLTQEATAPMARSITVDDTVTRLGNVSVFADRLTGTGSLQAPGDARITITNETANTLKLGDLIIPTYDAANVRFNGVLVHNKSDIERLNAAGAGAVGLTIVDKKSSTRPQITIASNYNPDSLVYRVPPVDQPQVAPDIILTAGSMMSNGGGAVSITSAAGNIYVYGEIAAGSLSIVARNGDFVSSYVNGFDHMGGDPGSFNDPTNVGEAGRGIIINGAISIAARYLNINSTIQSGIAEWTLDIGNNPMLTTKNAAHIGLSQSTVDNAVQAYLSSITNNGGAATSPIINLGNGVILNMGPEGLLASEAAGLQAAITNYLADPNRSPVRTVTIAGKLQSINIRDYISGGVEGRLEFSLTTLQAHLGATTPAQRYKLLTDGAAGTIGATYDASVKQYVVDGTKVNGGYIQLYGQIINTAYVGSGEPVGKLNVLDGFGTINITNSSNIPVILQALHTGEDHSGTGRGVEGKIEISDVTGVTVGGNGTPVVEIRRTTYTRSYDPSSAAAGQVQILTELGKLDANGIFLANAGGTSSATGGDRTATYNPTENLRYAWQIGTDYQSQLEYSYTRNSFFTISALTVSSHVSDMTLRSGPNILKQVRLADGTYLSTSQTVVNNTTMPRASNGLIVGQSIVTVDNSTLSNQALVSAEYSYQTGINIKTLSTSKSCIGWTLCTVWRVTTNYQVTQDYRTVTTHSLKADNPIGINFIGSDAGSINVSSGGDVVLTGAVNNAIGMVSIGAGGNIGSVGQDAVINAGTVNLTAGRSIGGINYTLPTGLPSISNAPAIAVMLHGGPLNAKATNGNVNVETRGDMKVGTVTAGGAVANGAGVVNLLALGSISGVSSAALIQGQRVRLSAGGSIGSTANGGQLKVNTGYSTDRIFGDPAIDPSMSTEPGYGLTARAGGDIGIVSSTWAGNADGTMLIDKVVSLGGNVRLVTPGRILDNNPVEAIDSRTYTQLLEYWESLGLMATDTARGIDGTLNAEKQAATIAAYERAQTQAYAQYWRIRQGQTDHGAVYDAGYVLTVDPSSALYSALTEQFGSAIRVEHPGYSDTQVADAIAQRISAYETSQTETYHELNAKLGGLTEHFDADYAYQASVAEQAELTRGATWTERQLAFSLSAGALKTVTSTNPVVKDPNVAGRTVSLEAGLGIGETIGADMPNAGIRIGATIDPRDLTLAQRIALASAERSDLHLAVEMPGGGIVDVPLGTDYQDMTTVQQAAFDLATSAGFDASKLTIVVLSKRPLNFDAPDGINVVVNGPVGGPASIDRGTAHLASRGNGVIGNITVPGETRIKVQGAIINASSGSAVNTGNLILEASQGGIGAGLDPVTGDPYDPFEITLADGATLTARAQDGVNIVFTGDALIDTVYSPQDVTLTAVGGSILNANKDLLINILGHSVTLDADGTIGTALHALNVSNGIGGGITAQASGLINLYGSAGHQFVISKAVSQSGSISLTAALDGLIDGAVTAPGQISLSAGERLVLSDRGIVQTSGGMIDVRSGSLIMADGSKLITSLGRVLIDVVGDAHMTDISSGYGALDDAAISVCVGGEAIFDGAVVAQGGISVSVDGRTVVSGRSSLTAALGSINVTGGALKMINGATMVSELGRIGIAVDGDALVTGIISGYQTAVLPDADGAFGATNAAVSISAGGRIFAGTIEPDRVDIETTAAGAGVYLSAGLGIGDKTQANDGWQGVNANQVTDVPNPLRIRTNALDLDAGGSVYLETLAKIISARMVVDPGDINVHGFDDFHGNLISAVNGRVTFDVEGDLTFDRLRAKSFDLSAMGHLSLPYVEVADEAILRAGWIDANITQKPAGPHRLKLTLTGYKGTVGNAANVFVDAPAGLNIGQLFFTEADLRTTARFVSIGDAFIPGSLALTTPLQFLLWENRTSLPQYRGQNVQLYQPGFAFNLVLNNYRTITNAYVVSYDETAEIIDILDQIPYPGASLMRDTIRMMYRWQDASEYDGDLWRYKESDEEEKEDADRPWVSATWAPYMVVGSGPAVNLNSRP